MNKKDEAILAWVREHRSDLVEHFNTIFTSTHPTKVANTKATEAFHAMVSIGFEAGRVFQSENPEIPLNSPHHYLETT